MNTKRKNEIAYMNTKRKNEIAYKAWNEMYYSDFMDRDGTKQRFFRDGFLAALEKLEKEGYITINRS